MRVYKCDPELKTAGVTMLAYIDNIHGEIYKPLLAKYGIEEIDPDGWYPVQYICDVFNDIVKNGDASSSFIALGMQIAEQSVFPPELEKPTMPMMLLGWNDHYVANHKDGDLPPVETVRLGDQDFQLVLHPDHIYPFDLVYGLAWGFCKQLLPPNTEFKVSYDEKYSPYVENAEKVVISITWK